MELPNGTALLPAYKTHDYKVKIFVEQENFGSMRYYNLFIPIFI